MHVSLVGLTQLDLLVVQDGLCKHMRRDIHTHMVPAQKCKCMQCALVHRCLMMKGDAMAPRIGKPMLGTCHGI